MMSVCKIETFKKPLTFFLLSLTVVDKLWFYFIKQFIGFCYRVEIGNQQTANTNCSYHC